MGKVIYCDFSRTERRKEIDDINQLLRERKVSKEEFDFYYKRNLELLKEEVRWSKCKYWK